MQLLLAEQYIRENIYNPITIADITAKTGINIRALQRLFRKYHNATPIQVLANFRIAAAHAMILRRTGNVGKASGGQVTFFEPRAV